MAATHDLQVDQGADFEIPFEWHERNPDGTAGDPIDISGYSAALQIRRHADDLGALLTLTDGAGLAIDGPAGKITVRIEAAQSSALPAEDSPFVYDLELTSGSGEVVRLVEGRVILDAEVTRV